MLSASVPLAVNTTSRRGAPTSEATWARARSTAARASRPRRVHARRDCRTAGEEGLHRPENARIERRGGGVVEVDAAVRHGHSPPVERPGCRAGGRRRSVPASRPPSCRRRSCRFRRAGCRAEKLRRDLGRLPDRSHERVDPDPVSALTSRSRPRAPRPGCAARNTSRSACETRSIFVTTAMSARDSIGPTLRGRFIPLVASSTASPRPPSTYGEQRRQSPAVSMRNTSAPGALAHRRASPSTIALQWSGQSSPE